MDNTATPENTFISLKQVSSILWSRLILWSPVWPRTHFPPALVSNVGPQQAINTQFLSNTKQFKKTKFGFFLDTHLPFTAPWWQMETEHKPVKTTKFYENTSWRHQLVPHSATASGYTVSFPPAFRNSYKYGYSAHTSPIPNVTSRLEIKLRRSAPGSRSAPMTSTANSKSCPPTLEKQTPRPKS